MVRIEEQKQATQNLPIENLPLPAVAYFPLSQHLGKIAVAEVAVGDLVSTGQRIAKPQAHVSSPIHASLSGKVTSIGEWPHPLLGRCNSIIIESDGLDNPQVAGYRAEAEVEKLTPEEIRNIVFEAGIVGMGGAGFPAQIKLNPPKAVDTLIINGAECEPFLTGDYRLMLEKSEEILQGMEIIARCLGVRKIIIAIEDNKPEAINKFESSVRRTPYAVEVLKSSYPQGCEKQLIKNVSGKEVPRGKLPFEVGVVVHNVATVYAIYEAVYFSKPLYERVVTVTGSCLTHPKNIRVRLGTPIKFLIDFCGPLKQEPAKLLIGGPMMGLAQYTDCVPVIKTTTGIVLLSKEEVKLREEEFCIRCGACVRECPAGLMPCLINLASEKELWTEAKAYGALDCIECGLCNYVCPAKRTLTQSIKRAKLEAAR